jgi:hypothetical protein
MTEATTGTSTKLRLLGLVAVLVAGCVALYAVDWGFLSSEFTSYEVRCGLPAVDIGQCSQLPTTGHFVSTYKIFREQQFVVAGDTKYTKCEIMSRTDWKCTYDDDSTLSFGAKNGAFWETVPEGYRAHGFFVPRWKFLLIEMGF